MVEDKKFFEMGRGDAAVCGPFRPLVSLRSRRAALDVTKPVRGSERPEPLSWMTCRLYYSPREWLAVVKVAAAVHMSPGANSVTRRCACTSLRRSTYPRRRRDITSH